MFKAFLLNPQPSYKFSVGLGSTVKFTISVPFFLLSRLSLCPCYTFSPFFFYLLLFGTFGNCYPFTLHPFLGLQWVPSHFFWVMSKLMSRLDKVRCSSNLQSHLVSFLLPLLSFLLPLLSFSLTTVGAKFSIIQLSCYNNNYQLQKSCF